MVISDAILLGAGVGKRFNPALPKQFHLLGSAPVFIHALKSLLSTNCYRQIILAFPQDYLELAQQQLEQYLPQNSPQTIIRVIAGGERRQDSSMLALDAIEAITPLPTRITIHDACRPYLSTDFLGRIRQCIEDRSYGAWVPVIPVVDTLKKVENDRVVETVDRDLVHRVQTPQIFEYDVIRSLVEKLKEPEHEKLNFTDDASLCEYFGIPVGTYVGDVKNIKVTYDFELEILRGVLERGEGLKEAQKDLLCAPASDTIFTA